MAETAVTVLLGLAPAYLAWHAFRADRADADPVDADRVVDELAVAVRNQWDSEAAVRRVNDPYPLPVAWQAADDSLTESWSLLADLARAWPGGPPGDPALWPPDTAGLAGRDAEIGQVFLDRAPTRRLVILGEPGAGKSVLLIRLLQDLIARRTTGDPVPVLFSLASWDPHQPLQTWMADQLRRTYPGLAAPAPASVAFTDTANNNPSDLAAHLLRAGRILPLLDGFDELPPTRHATALDMINRALPARQPLVLTSRTGPYRTALTRPGITVRLNGAAAIQLLSLNARDAADYLRRDAGGPHAPAAHRWNTVITHLGTSSPVGHALATPLGLFLARTIYNPRPDTHAGPPGPHPDELCDTSAYPDHTTISTHLFRAFIPAAYTPHQPQPPRWTADQAHDTLVFLAQFLQQQRTGSPDLVWWELPGAVPRLVRSLATALPVGLVGVITVGLGAGLAAGLTTGLAAGLTIGLAAGFAFGLAWGLAGELPEWVATPGIRLRFSLPMFLSGLTAGLAAVLLFGFTGVLGGSIGDLLASGLTAMLLAGTAVGLVLGLATGLETDAPDLTASSGPITLYDLDRQTYLMATLMPTLVPMLVIGPLVGLVLGLGGGLEFGLIAGTSVAAVTQLAHGRADTAWKHFVVARAYLALHRNIPWNLMAFLQDAHERRGVLRQVGAVYQFRHIDLQRHLAQ
ncbi:NACHT domain-containing protein [Streptomyces sp. NPDC127066]|uniref:NACHT domain-containing protein n=1 Tax=Streptomyces sp. NPDC127066 TaxID=3347125 RepID=UPI0036556443